MVAITDNLIHFLGRQYKDSPMRQFEICKSIFVSGLRTGKYTIKFANAGSVHNQVVCFTDIPLKDCNEHTSIYGKFGIGFKKSYVKNMGGNPARYFVDYIPGFSDLTRQESRGALYHNMCLLFNSINALNQSIHSDPNFTLYDGGGKVLLFQKLNDP